MNKISEKLMFQEANKRGVKMSKLGHFSTKSKWEVIFTIS